MRISVTSYDHLHPFESFTPHSLKLHGKTTIIIISALIRITAFVFHRTERVVGLEQHEGKKIMFGSNFLLKMNTIVVQFVQILCKILFDIIPFQCKMGYESRQNCNVMIQSPTHEKKMYINNSFPLFY